MKIKKSRISGSWICIKKSNNEYKIRQIYETNLKPAYGHDLSSHNYFKNSTFYNKHMAKNIDHKLSDMEDVLKHCIHDPEPIVKSIYNKILVSNLYMSW